MSSLLPEPRHGFFPSRAQRRLGDQIERALQHAETTGALDRQRDQLAIARVQQAAAHGLVAVAQISSVEATLGQALPHAQGRLKAIADAGTIGIVGVVARSGF